MGRDKRDLIVLDASALVSIALREQGSDELADRASRGPCIIGAPTLLEVHIVLRRRLGEEADEAIRSLMEELDIEIVPFSLSHLNESREAFDIYGKGRHKASLNFGDCMAYAVAKEAGQALLFTGDDFTHTDVKRA